MGEVLVSICLISYNHKNFIGQALASIANQKTNFRTELIIADDGSNDGTKAIIESFLGNYKGKAVFINRPNNIGPADNFIHLISSATGKYVAYLEGDDYWTAGHKLQMQVDFLESNSNVAVSSHNSWVLPINGKPYLIKQGRQTGAKDELYKINDYIIKGFFHSSSIMYRRSMLPVFPDWYRTAFAGDNFLVLLLAMNGKIHYNTAPLSVYRVNTDSISNYHSRFEINENFAFHFSRFNEFSNYKYEKYIIEATFALNFELHYYHPSYLKKVSFALRNIKNILQFDKNAFPRAHRIRIFLPTFLLRSRIDIFSKKT